MKDYIVVRSMVKKPKIRPMKSPEGWDSRPFLDSIPVEDPAFLEHYHLPPDTEISGYKITVPDEAIILTVEGFHDSEYPVVYVTYLLPVECLEVDSEMKKIRIKVKEVSTL